MEQAKSGRLVQPYNFRIRGRRYRRQSRRLAIQATLTKTITLLKKCDGRFLAKFGSNADFDRPSSYKKDGISWLTLQEHALIPLALASGLSRGHPSEMRFEIHGDTLLLQHLRLCNS